MLKLKIVAEERFDHEKEEFIDGEVVAEITLEHSLVSLSKWEARWEKPFLSSPDRTSEQTISYIQDMSVDGDLSIDLIRQLSEEQIQEISDYIASKQTATIISESKNAPSNAIITSEIIYYWMVTLNIPFECENWHLSRLLTLVQVINRKNEEASKGNKSRPPTRSELDKRRALNEKRRAEQKARENS